MEAVLCVHYSYAYDSRESGKAKVLLSLVLKLEDKRSPTSCKQTMSPDNCFKLQLLDLCRSKTLRAVLAQILLEHIVKNFLNSDLECLLKWERLLGVG